MKLKFVKKYMRMAKFVAEDQNPCLSRSIGVVIVDPIANKVLGTGYNGPPRDVPHCDDPEYLREVVWPQLTQVERFTALPGVIETTPEQQCEQFCQQFGNQKICPRKVVGAESGKRLELCSCAHGETNAIINAGGVERCIGAEAYCYCGVPCYECTKLIIAAKIKKIYIVQWGADYSHGSRWLFKKAGIEIEEHPESYYLDE